MTFDQWYFAVGIDLPCWRDKDALKRAWEAGAEHARSLLGETVLELLNARLRSDDDEELRTALRRAWDDDAGQAIGRM